ncbi:MAG: GNAT family N-acetyltransferase [Catenulispora sp.]|nr:GNAT family N-acetyltransferase [Catenulispora sp.]
MTKRAAMRLATPDDLPRLRDLARDALLHDPDAATIVDLLWNGAADGCRIVAEAGDGADRRSGSDGSDHTADTAKPDHSPILGFALGSLRPARGDQPATGHIDLLVVPATHRGHGIGRALLADLERRLVAASAARLRIRGNPPNYAWPGIDIRYTPAACLAASAGYERLLDANNMLVDLAGAHRNGLLATDADVSRLAALGVEVRRAEPKDEEGLCAWVEATFGGSWAKECAMAVRNERPSLHVAVRDGAFLGFAAHGAQRAHVFGPMGTDAAARGLGIGAVLLRRCLTDQHDAGVAVAEIGWVGPVRFYARAVGARLGRVFWTFEKAVA